MADYRFRIVNVFAEEHLAGNPLCVFEDARGLEDVTMQAVALQFNLSETTFLFPSSRATACVRIFTPTFEMPFAGHPTLGTAAVVHELHAADPVLLEMHAGLIPVTHRGDVWTLRANPPRTRAHDCSQAERAAMLGLAESDVGDGARWVDTGSEQLVIPLHSADAVRRCRPDGQLLARHGSNGRRDGLAYVWAREDATTVLARFFFLKHGAVIEDPGTGSACANLGGWLLESGSDVPLELRVHQGEQTGRRCVLGLRLDAERQIHVSGRVRALGSGTVDLP